LSENDATSAFAGLVESETIERKAENFKGSSNEDEDGGESLIT
jgi:hypothetical protein